MAIAEIFINNRPIGKYHPTYIIAEIGINHNGILEYAYKLIDIAIQAKVDAVKFQKRNLSDLYIEKYLKDPNSSEKGLKYILSSLQKFELPDSVFPELKQYANDHGVDFLCTAFDLPSLKFIARIGVPAFKISSSDLTNIPLIKEAIKEKKPLLLSTGMSTESELCETVRYLKSYNAEFALLHCNSTYPVSFDNINLCYLQKLMKFGCPVGYSGHEPGIAISTSAVAFGARIIERHITIDRSMEGPDHASSLEPQGMSKMVRDIRNLERAMGDENEKYFTRGEILNREILGKSLWSSQKVTKGTIISESMVKIRSPALGISPQKITKLIGKRAKRDIFPDEPFVQNDIDEITDQIGDKFFFKHTYGLIARPKDISSIVRLNPKFIEIHMTSGDIDHLDNVCSLEFPIIYHAPEFWDRNLLDLCAIDEVKRQQSIQFLQHFFDILIHNSKKKGEKTKVVVHPGAMSLDSPLSQREDLQTNLIESIEEVQNPDIEILLENLPPRPWYFGGQWYTNCFMDAEEISGLLKEMDVSFCYDTSHHKLYCNYAKVDFLDQVKILKPNISHIHISDASGVDGEGLQIGEGSIPWQDFFSLIKDIDYTFVPEIWRGHQNNNLGFLQALNKLKQYDGV